METLAQFQAIKKDTFLDRTLVNPSKKQWTKIKNGVGATKMFLHIETRNVETEEDIDKEFENVDEDKKNQKGKDEKKFNENKETENNQEIRENKKKTDKRSNKSKEKHKSDGTIVVEGQQNVQTDHEDENSVKIKDDRKKFERISQLPPEKKQEYERKSSDVHNALTGFRIREQFFQKVKRGSKEDIQMIDQWLKDDPELQLRESDDPDRQCNRAYHDGKTPLFAACENGNIKVVEILLKHKSNPYQLSYMKDSNTKMSILQSASRWNHSYLQSYLINNIDWPPEMLKEAYNSANNAFCKTTLKEEMNKKGIRVRQLLWCVCFDEANLTN